MKRSLNSVGLVGDGDETDVIEGLEALFLISITDAEAERIETLGQMHRLICAKLPDRQPGQGKCKTAMAYYRLNAGLASRRKPETLMRVPPGSTPRDYLAFLERESGMNLEGLTRPARLTTSLYLAQFVSWLIGPMFLRHLLAQLSVFSFSQSRTGFGELPEGSTVRHGLSPARWLICHCTHRGQISVFSSSKAARGARTKCGNS